MFTANLTLGLYVQFVPRHLTPNSTVDIVTLQGTEPPATAFNYLTLIPLLATMLFIMGRSTSVMGRPGMGCLGDGDHKGSITVLGCLRSWGVGESGPLATQSHHVIPQLRCSGDQAVLPQQYHQTTVRRAA